MAASTRACVAALTLDSPLTTRETVLSPTPASAATSRMVAGRTSGEVPDNVFSSNAAKIVSAWDPDKSYRCPRRARRDGGGSGLSRGDGLERPGLSIKEP